MELGERSDRLLGWALRLAIFNESEMKTGSGVYYTIIL